MAPVWALMVAFDEPLSLDVDAAQVNVGPLGFVCRETSKPGRRGPERWVLHATSAWTEAHLEASEETVSAQLLEAFFATTGARVVTPARVQAHRWRYALTTKPLGVDCVVHESGRVVLCGDWCLGTGVEAAWLSGQAAAGRLNAIPPSLIVEPPPLRTPSQMRLV